MTKNELRRIAPPGDTFDSASLACGIDDYLDHLEMLNYSSATISAHSRSLASFAQWATDRGISKSTEITYPMLERYQRHLYLLRKSNGDPLSFKTQLYRLVPIRGLFRFLVRDRRVPSNPASELLLPKQGHSLPRSGLSLDQVEAVMAVPDVKTPLGVRDRAMLEVFYSTAIRRGELVRLRTNDFNADEGTLFVHRGKGNKDRYVPIGERAIGWVNRYRCDVRPHLTARLDDGWLFLESRGQQFSDVWVTKIVSDYLKAAGVKGGGSCHLFRHTCATLMLDGGADLRYVQEMLGHSVISSTQIYTHVAIAKLKAVHAATHPGAKNPQRVGGVARSDVDGGVDDRGDVDGAS
jgi:integrase/recombinase XerD